MNILAFGIGNLANPDLFIILLIVLVLFGANKLPGLERSAAQRALLRICHALGRPTNRIPYDYLIPEGAWSIATNCELTKA
jgi:hypothetical protein